VNLAELFERTFALLARNITRSFAAQHHAASPVPSTVDVCLDGGDAKAEIAARTFAWEAAAARARKLPQKGIVLAASSFAAARRGEVAFRS
jgi:hypothetical protein